MTNHINGATRRALLSILLVAQCFCAAPADELSRSQLELEQLQDDIRRLQETLAARRASANHIAAELDALEEQTHALDARIREGDDNLRDLRRRQTLLQNQNHAAQQQLVESRATLAQLARGAYQLGGQSGLRLLLNQETPGAVGRNLALYRYVIAARRQQLAAVRAQQKQLAKTQMDLQNNARALAAQLESLAEDRAQLSRADKQRRLALAKVRRQLAAGEAQAELFGARERELNQLLTQLNPAHTVKILPRAFAARKGKLPPPLRAEIIARFGEQKAQSGLQWKGWMYRARAGQNVAAIHPAQVVYADWFAGYGRLIVLDHGGGYMSVYAHNRRLRADFGERVRAGQAIAEVGVSGGLDAPGLYFEIRYNGQPANPRDWLAAN